MNHRSVIRSRNRRQSDSSQSATSHSSRSQRPSPWVHHAPEVRHGPAACSTRPPGMPRRSMATWTGRPRSTMTRTAIGGRNRRRTTCPERGRNAAESKGPRERRAPADLFGLNASSSKPSGHSESASTGEPRRQRRERFVRRQRPLEQRVLHDARGRRVHLDGDDVDPGRRRVRLEIEQQQCPQHTRVAHGRRQLQQPCVRRSIHQAQIQADRRRAAIGALEGERQRIEQPRQHERQRLQRVDGPLELHRLQEPRHAGIRHERRAVGAAREPLQREPFLPHPLRQIGRGQRGHLAETFQTPAGEDLDERC